MTLLVMFFVFALAGYLLLDHDRFLAGAFFVLALMVVYVALGLPIPLGTSHWPSPGGSV